MWRDFSQGDQTPWAVNLAMWAPQFRAELSVTRIFDRGAEAKETPLHKCLESPSTTSVTGEPWLGCILTHPGDICLVSILNPTSPVNFSDEVSYVGRQRCMLSWGLATWCTFWQRSVGRFGGDYITKALFGTFLEVGKSWSLIQLQWILFSEKRSIQTFLCLLKGTDERIIERYADRFPPLFVMSSELPSDPSMGIPAYLFFWGRLLWQLDTLWIP